MIKRLKWNVLYGSDDEAANKGDSSSDDSDNEYEKATVALAQLARNDPTLKLPEKESDAKFVDEEYSDGDGSSLDEDDNEGQQEEEEEEGKFIEWQECNLCPGKRFLNEREVESHLKSKDHQRNVRRYDGLETDDESIGEEKPKRMSKAERKLYRKQRLLELGKANVSKPADDDLQVDEEADMAEVAELKKEEAAEDKKKAATKRKLKKMKERRWKKKQEQAQKEKENAQDENVFQPSPLPSSHRKESGSGGQSKTTKKRPKKDTPSSAKKKKKARKAAN